ncbi:hypothetical protein [Pararhodospirillum photometricum]|uniref:HTH iclR-type domain-containing protein n=1 Tax=Pararhodospirillum photometricum DSM 122 TaxID=1150469 RepID=H6SQM0_PARPM|nr:hypothetical protein [Pararhodospirillum photometricum]CCG07335.1 Putative uncharacterized protein [Pararhodospirillum photometricum DSM 122]
MGRLPVDEVARLSVRVPRGRQGIWQTIRALAGGGGGAFTLPEVMARSAERSKETVRTYLRCLEAGGIVVREGLAVDGGAMRYRLVADPGPEAPRLRRDGSPAALCLGTEQMWRVLRMASPGLDARELSVTASTEEHPVALGAAAAYLRALHHAGYLAVVEAGRPGHKPGTGKRTVYRLTRCTGPLAPQIQRIRAVWDPNLSCHMGEGVVEGGHD